MNRDLPAQRAVAFETLENSLLTLHLCQVCISQRGAKKAQKSDYLVLTH